jgi:hypothetical protein
MDARINMDQFSPLGCQVKSRGINALEAVFAEEGGKLCLAGESGKVGGVDWNKAKYIVVDVTSLEEWTTCITFAFWKASNSGDQPDMTIGMSVFPGLKTRLALPLEALNGQNMFLSRTPGKLKTVVFNNGIPLREINRFALGTLKCFAEQKITISDLHLTDKEPDYPLPDVKLVDELGQWTTKEWSGKTGGVEALKAYLQSELAAADGNESFFQGWSVYGGWKGKRFNATGYFRTEHDGNRWWLVDPQGCAFFSTGLDCVNPGDSCKVSGIEKFFTFLPPVEGEYKEAWLSGEKAKKGEYYNFAVSNLIRAFGAGWRESWSRITRRRMVEWGFNTIANWSSLEFAQKAGLPYVWPLTDFPTTERIIFRDFPDVFSPEYEHNAEIYAEQLYKFEGDRYLIGYFLRNEPQWAFIEDLNIAEELLQCEGEYASREALIEFLSERYNDDIDRLNKAWNLQLKGFEILNQPMRKASLFSAAAEKDLKDFSRMMIERYVRIPSVAAKRVDPYHLNLGMRYGYIASEDLLAGHENFDVFSINCYKMNPAKEVEEVGKLTGLPVMIGEFHFGALDRGLNSTGLRGVTSQEERGRAYEYYMENGAFNPYCVGAHYFILNDQALLGRFDGENFQIGCVDVCHRPYVEFVEGIMNTNRTVYEVAAGLRQPSARPAREMERNGI